jgi:hypothetical protein
MIKLLLICSFLHSADTIHERWWREWYPYNRSDTSYITDDDNPYYHKGDTMIFHHWTVGYHFKGDSLFKDGTNKFYSVDSRKPVYKDTVLVITCDTIYYKAIELWKFEEIPTYSGGGEASLRRVPKQYLDVRTHQRIHNICQVVEFSFYECEKNHFKAFD